MTELLGAERVDELPVGAFERDELGVRTTPPGHRTRAAAAAPVQLGRTGREGVAADLGPGSRFGGVLPSDGPAGAGAAARRGVGQRGVPVPLRRLPRSDRTQLLMGSIFM
ncbi:hypothetical protein GCM10023084_59600 [Streptomyces lacrimifluminis]|uniref:Uncharacterized protein n=1 Tax=Streptomyces lacrimifluminis TaxID=1500077 RepID=A0A917LE40_9ACTN|nr:hypothetical protein GCM10012282_62550 [Streptomyces lacrimifluminis]